MKPTDRILQQIALLPKASPVMNRVLQLIDEEDVGAEQLVSVIEKDIGVTANLLRLCNTPQYAGSRRLGTLKEAVSRLGTKTIMQLILMGESQSLFKSALPGYGYDGGDLWLHSLGVAEASRLVAIQAKQDRPALAFTGGLLHDLGKVVLDTFWNQESKAIRARLARGATVSEAENEVLGVEHAELGGRIAESWGFPDALAGMIRWHHQPSAAKSDPELCAVVHLADALNHWLGVGLGAPSLVSRFDAGVLARLSLVESDLDQLLVQLGERMERAQNDLAA